MIELTVYLIIKNHQNDTRLEPKPRRLRCCKKAPHQHQFPLFLYWTTARHLMKPGNIQFRSRLLCNVFILLKCELYNNLVVYSDHRQSVTLDHSISGHRIKKQLTVCRGSVLNPFPRSTSSSVSAESSRLISTKSKSQIFYFFFFVSVATVPDRDQTGKHCHLSKTHTFLIICFKTQMSESTFMYDLRPTFFHVQATVKQHFQHNAASAIRLRPILLQPVYQHTNTNNLIIRDRTPSSPKQKINPRRYYSRFCAHNKIQSIRTISTGYQRTFTLLLLNFLGAIQSLDFRVCLYVNSFVFEG